MNEIVRGKRGVTADTAQWLPANNMSADFWLNPQTFDDVRIAQTQAVIQISRQVKPWQG